MKRLLIIGCGDVAMRTIPLLTAHYRVFALVRNPAYCAELRVMGVIPLSGDLDDRASLARIAGLADTVLHFAPPAVGKSPLSTPLANGRGAFEFTDTRTRNLLNALLQACPEPFDRLRINSAQRSRRSKLPKRLVYISTSGVYGDCGGTWVSETHPLNAKTARAQRRADAEMQIRNWARRNRVKASILRVPGIYAADRLPLERLRTGTPAIVQEEDSYTNHIHADDLARIVVSALRYAKPNRVYHASDDSRLKMGEYFDSVADAFGLPRVPRTSRAEAQRVLPETLRSFMNESRRLTNQRMKRELKTKLRYPTVESFLATIECS